MNVTYKSVLLNWLPLLAYCLVIFYLSSKPDPDLLPGFKYADKILHCLAFTVLGILCFRAFRSLGIRPTLFRIIVLSLVFSTTFGIFIELNQYFIPYRMAETMDIAADMLGSVVGIIAALLFYRNRSKA